MGVPRHLSFALPAGSALSQSPSRPPPHLLPSLWRRPFLSHGSAGLLLGASVHASCPRPSERAGSVAAASSSRPHRGGPTWRVLSPSFLCRFGSCFTLTPWADADSSPVCVPLLLRCRGRAVPPARGCVCHCIPLLFLLVCWVCLRLSPAKGVGDHAGRPGPGMQAQPHWRLFWRRYDEDGQGVSISSP